MNAPNAPGAHLDVPNDDAAASGLSEAEAARRLATDGPNDSGRGARRSWPRILADAAREPMFLLLVVAALLYLLLGELAEGLFLSLMVAVTLGLTMYQEAKTERALAALRQLAAPRPFYLRRRSDRRRPGRPARRRQAVPCAAAAEPHAVDRGRRGDGRAGGADRPGQRPAAGAFGVIATA